MGLAKFFGTRDVSREDLVRSSIIISFFIWALAFLIVLFSTTLFFIRLKMQPVVFPLSAAVSLLLLFCASRFYFRENALRVFLAIVSFLASLCAVCFMTANTIYDVSWDGQDYHQVGIVRIAQGWNPVYEDVPSNISNDHEVSLWVKHYPRAAWICAASVYAATGNIEHGKIFNLLFIVAAFFLTLALMLSFEKIGAWTAFWLSLIAALNPVAAYQSLGFYVDGQVSSVVTGLLALCGLVFLKRKDVLIYGLLLALGTMLINLKFTGLAFAFIVFCGLIVGTALVYRNARSVASAIGVCLLAGTAGLLFIGYSPYVTNLVGKGHPFFPIYGKGRVENVMTKNYPKNFRSLGSLGRFMYSIFSATGVSFRDGEFQDAELKIPFTVAGGEIQSLSAGDPRAGGFGPLFGGIVLVSSALFAFAGVKLAREGQVRIVLCHLAIVVWIAISVSVVTESWWARFIPQLWLVPLAMSVLVLNPPGGEEGYGRNRSRRLARHLVRAVIAVCVLNVALTCLCYSRRVIEMNQALYSGMNRLRRADREIIVHLELFETSTRLKLERWGVKYREDNTRGNVKIGMKAGRSIPYFGKDDCDAVVPFVWNDMINEACIPGNGSV